MVEIHYIHCSHKHEDPGLDTWSTKATVARIHACPLRKEGRNILCAHLGIKPAGEKEGVLQEIRCRMEKLGADDLLNEIDELQALKLIVDECVRRSFTLKDIPYFRGVTPELGRSGIIAEALEVMEDVLSQCNIVSIDIDGDSLNPEQREQFYKSVSVIQEEISQGFKRTIGELDKREAQQIVEHLK